MVRNLYRKKPVVILSLCDDLRLSVIPIRPAPGIQGRHPESPVKRILDKSCRMTKKNEKTCYDYIDNRIENRQQMVFDMADEACESEGFPTRPRF